MYSHLRTLLVASGRFLDELLEPKLLASKLKARSQRRPLKERIVQSEQRHDGGGLGMALCR